MNVVHLIGNLGKDIEIKVFPESQTKVGTFSLAVKRIGVKEGKQDTDWIRCKVWGKLADIMDMYVHQGDKIAVSGRLETSSSEKDGVKTYYTDVVVERMEMLNSKKIDGSGYQKEQPKSTGNYLPEEDDMNNDPLNMAGLAPDDLPF